MHTTLKIYSVAVLLAAWVGLSFVFSEQIIPGPIPVFEAILDNMQSGDGLFHLYKTVSRVVLGLILAMFLGSGLGLVMGLSIKGEKFFESWVMVGLTIPAVVYAIICLLWFGLNDSAAVIAIGITAFPAVAINMWQGVKDIDMQLIAMGKAFRLPTRDLIRKIVLPQTVPYVLAATRYALGISWKIATTVELIGMSSGVGYMLHYWFGLFSMTQVFAWTLTFVLVLLFIEYVLINPFEKRATAWRPAVQV
ncbi:MAG: ABC transporter permease [Deltaproteobacteria bacterium]|nr:ABC transporter permease [Deltaproteobacteria bacterium]MBI2228962.1 ABC transporter permease [Deltaproteobacteria bacterium]MBI2534647.1 ABC transporter permease [Deltaproteobacteria bacterium]